MEIGDTLSGISEYFRIPVSEIKRINRLRGSTIIAGKSILLPIRGSDGSAYIKKRTVRQTGLDLKKCLKISYLVQDGDSLYSIAVRFDVKIAHLKQYNKLRSDVLQPGDEIDIYIEME